MKILGAKQIQSITDNLDSTRSTSYVYDAWARLKQATAGPSATPTWSLSYDYDRFGNRRNQNVVGGTGPGVSLTIDPNTNRIQDVGYAYDSSGNLTNDTFHSYAYDAENRTKTVDSTGATYTYSGPLRVKKVAGGTTTVYIFSGSKPIAEYANGALSKEYVYAGGRLLTTIAADGTTTYQHPDHLSIRAETDAAGNLTRSFGHYPFGESWYENGSTNKWQFTSYERDSESGLDYAMFRNYSSRLGRFMQADLMGGSLRGPQSLNRYTYVNNDPMNLADPLGLDPTCWTLVRDSAGNLISVEVPCGKSGPDDPSDVKTLVVVDAFGCGLVVSDGAGGVQGYLCGPGPAGGGGKPLECRPDFIARSQAAWQASGSGMIRNAEAGFEVSGTTERPSYKDVREPPRGALGLSVGPNTIATFHTHPDNLSAYPTIPGEDQGRLRPGDKAYVPFYVGSQEGLFVSDPKAENGYRQLRKGLDWLKPCD